MEPTDLINYANAIKRIESSGNYGALGPATRNGDRAYGAYQVMGNNIPDWTKQHYGQALTPQQFCRTRTPKTLCSRPVRRLRSEARQPARRGVHVVLGPPLAGNNSNDGSIAVPEYVRRFNAALGNGGGALNAINAAAGAPKAAVRTFVRGGAHRCGPQGCRCSDRRRSVPGRRPRAAQQGARYRATLANVGAAIAGISSPAQGANLRAIASGISEKAKARTTSATRWAATAS
jgi:hypothetical protein